MSDPSAGESTTETAARMELGPDELHEGDDGLYVDCPQCGSIARIQTVVNEGHCENRLDSETTETLDGDEEIQCTAELSLELVWEA